MGYMLTKREGRAYVQISYDNGAHWQSTKCKTLIEAEIKFGKNAEMTLGEFSKDFYKRKDSGSYLFTMKMRNIELVPTTIWTKQSILDTYIIPAFGNIPIKEVKAKDISRWILPLKAYRSRKPLGYSMKKLILWVFREILDYAVEDGLVDSNEAKKVKTIRKVKKVQPFLSNEEIEKLFPPDDNELIKIWGSQKYALFFLIMKDTGFRPSEVCGLMYEDIRDDAVYTDRIFDVFTKKIEQRIKTSSKGQKYKVGTFSDQTIRLLEKGTGYIFSMPEMDRRKTNYHFKKVCRTVLNRSDVNQKCLRHAFMTYRISKLPRELIMELMGHTAWESCYDDRTPEMIIDELRTALNRYQT